MASSFDSPWSTVKVCVSITAGEKNEHANVKMPSAMMVIDKIFEAKSYAPLLPSFSFINK